MEVFLILLISIIHVLQGKGLHVKYYDDEFCVIKHGAKTDDDSESWFLLDVCYADYTFGEVSSQINVIQKDENGTLQIANYFFSYTDNCTGENIVIWDITFGEYDKCVKTEFGQHVKVIEADQPPKIGFNQVTMSIYGANTNCSGPVVEVSYQILHFCIWNGDFLHPRHSKKECKDKETKTELPHYIIYYWEKLLSECLYDPDSDAGAVLGLCYEGLSGGLMYDCKN